MHQLVAQDVIVLRVVAGQRHDHAVHKRIGEAAGPLSDDLRRRRGLLEVGGVGVEHDRLARERVVEHSRVAGVPALRHPADVIHYVGLAVVVVDVEVLRLQDLEVEVFPLHFVASEVLRLCCGGEEKKGEKGEDGFTHRFNLRVGSIGEPPNWAGGCKFAAATSYSR